MERFCPLNSLRRLWEQTVKDGYNISSLLSSIEVVPIILIFKWITFTSDILPVLNVSEVKLLK